jgi:hypothetical protein
MTHSEGAFEFEGLNQRYVGAASDCERDYSGSGACEVFGEPLLASAALDRLAHDAHQIVITGESYRTRATRRRSADKKAGNEARADA